VAKQRTIDPRIWQHKAFLRSPWHCRDVFFYLFSAACDDEGRFDWDPLAILEGAFPRAYPVTEDDVIADLQHLVNEGLALRYGDADEYGFLCGWFEHQYIQADRRTPSSLPEPPVRVPSWAAADGVRDACAKHLGRGLKQVTYHDAIDWLTGRERSVNGSLTERSPEVEVEGEVESKGNDSSPRPADAPSLELILEPDPPKPPARSKLDPAQVQADIDAARATFPQDLLSGIDAFLDACRAENKTGAIALTRERTETQSLAAAYAKLGDGPFRYGLDAALRKGAANVNYLKTAAGSYSADAPRRPQANAYDDPQEAARREYAEQHDRLFGGVR